MQELESNKGVYCGRPSMSCQNYHLIPLCSYTCLPLPFFSSYWECPLCKHKTIVLIPEDCKNQDEIKTIEEEIIQEDTTILPPSPFKENVFKAVNEAIQNWLPIPGICVNTTVRCIFCNIKTNLRM